MKKISNLIKEIRLKIMDHFEVERNKKKRGFTLVEVMITVTIIGILSSMAMISYSKAQEKAKKNVDYATAANIATAAQIAATDGAESSSINLSYLVSNKYLQSKPEVQQNIEGDFVVTVGADDTVTVTLGNSTYYPKPLTE